MRQVFRYNTKALWGDYLRAGLGITVTLAPLLFLPANPAIVVILGGLTALFVVFGIATYLRHRSVIFLEDDHVGVTGLIRRSFAWSTVGRVTLNYYTTRRDGSDGRMELRIGERKKSFPFFFKDIVVESTLEGFETIAAAAFAAVQRHSLRLNSASVVNFRALGLTDDAFLESNPRTKA